MLLLWFNPAASNQDLAATHWLLLSQWDGKENGQKGKVID